MANIVKLPVFSPASAPFSLAGSDVMTGIKLHNQEFKL